MTSTTTAPSSATSCPTAARSPATNVNTFIDYIIELVKGFNKFVFSLDYSLQKYHSAILRSKIVNNAYVNYIC